MPTYAYACQSCGHSFEVRQSFSDDALTVCPECSGSLRKLFNNVGIVFKGSGFYRNDSRGSSSSTESSSTNGSSNGSGKESGKESSSSTSSTPAKESSSSSKPATGGSSSGSKGSTSAA